MKEYAQATEHEANESATPAQPEEPPPIAVGTGGSISTGTSRMAKAAPKMAPTMPCCVFSGPTWKHREKIADIYGMRGLAAVARPVKAQEIRSNSDAQAAMDKEWKSLRALKAWDEEHVREWSDVAKEAKSKKEIMLA